MAQSLERLTSAQVMVSQFVGWNPATGSVLTAQKPGACFRFCISLSLSFSLSLSLSPASPAHALPLKNKC